VATELKPVYLITGSDRPKIQRALRRLRDRIGDEATELFSAVELSGDDAVAACNAPGLFGTGARLVVVGDADRWKAADVKAIASYLAAPAPDKLATWAGDDPIGVADVEQLAAGCAEIPGYELTDAWGRRDLAGVLAACQTLLERSGDPVSRTVPALVGLLVGHVGRVRSVQTLVEEGLAAREIASRVKRHPFYVEKLVAQARNYSVDELRDAIVRLAALDHAVKGGSRLAVDLELERALVDITHARDAVTA
jgi:DNA polymerase III delta subunit